jgi:hypothetical protein
MKILTIENTPYDLDTIPDEIDDIRYCVLDAANADDVDIYFLPLVFLESFQSPAVCLQIGKYELQMPMDWSIMICDAEYTALEILPLAGLNNRGFRALCTNPMFSKLESEEIQITGVYQDVKWHFPKLKHGHMLAMPLENKQNPRCAFFVKEVNKVCDLDLSDLV